MTFATTCLQNGNIVDELGASRKLEVASWDMRLLKLTEIKFWYLAMRIFFKNI